MFTNHLVLQLELYTIIILYVCVLERGIVYTSGQRSGRGPLFYPKAFSRQRVGTPWTILIILRVDPLVNHLQTFYDCREIVHRRVDDICNSSLTQALQRVKGTACLRNGLAGIVEH